MYDLYVKAVSFLASCASTAMMLTPLLVCKDIIQKHSSDHINASTFIGALLRSSLFCRQGFILNLSPMIFVHGLGLLFNTFYLSLYWYYSNKKKDIMTSMIKSTLLSMALLTYSFIESKDLITTRFPVIVSIIHLSLIGWPLLSIRETIRTKKWYGQPKPILINATVICTLWLLYSINIQNPIILTQCLIALLLCLTQMGLSIVYPAEISSNKLEKQE